MESKQWYCVICGNKIDYQDKVCSDVCSSKYHELKKVCNDNSDLAINGYCNFCGKPLILKKNRHTIPNRHPECYSSYLKFKKTNVRPNDSISELNYVNANINGSNKYIKIINPDSYSYALDSNIIFNNNYYNILIESTKNLDEYEGILENLPGFYLILCRIGCDNKSDWYTKMLVNSSLAYFMFEQNKLYSRSELDEYLEKLYLSAYVLSEIRDNISINLILDNAKDIKFNNDILQEIHNVCETASYYLGDRAIKILNIVGIDNFLKFDVITKDEISKNLVHWNQKRELLYAMAAVKVDEIFKDNHPNKNIEKIRSIIKKSPEYVDIKKYMEFIEDE